MQTGTRSGLDFGVMRARLARIAGPALGLLEVLVWAGIVVFALQFLALRYWLLPNIERYRDDIVAALDELESLTRDRSASITTPLVRVSRSRPQS